MRFCEIEGHEREKARLRMMIDSGRLPHSLLLHGESGIGKLLLARAMVQYLHCTNRTPDGDSCGMCSNCRQMITNNHTDTYFVYPVYKGTHKTVTSGDYISQWHEFLTTSPFASYGEWLKILDCGNSQPCIYVDESAEIIHRMSIAPLSAKCKVILLWLPEKMNVEAANKLLKIIEEPQPNSYFILVSNNIKEVLGTIVSRSQPVEVARMSVEEMANYLSNTLSVEHQQAYNAANIADGDMNYALSTFRVDSETDEFFKLFVSIMRCAYQVNVNGLKDVVETVSNSQKFGREKQVRMLKYFAHMIRENFMLNTGVDALTHLSENEMMFCKKFAPFINERNIELINNEINLAIRDIMANCNAKVVFFDFSLKFASFLRK